MGRCGWVDRGGWVGTRGGWVDRGGCVERAG